MAHVLFDTCFYMSATISRQRDVFDGSDTEVAGLISTQDLGVYQCCFL